MSCGARSGIPCPDGGPCWDACALDGTDCGVWEPIYWPEPVTDPALLQAGPEQRRPKACGDCAYRPGSPERREVGGGLPEGLSPRRTFHCHDGMPGLVGWTYPGLDYSLLAERDDPDGFLLGPSDYQPVHRHGRGYQVDGRPLVVCAGWAAHALNDKAVR